MTPNFKTPFSAFTTGNNNPISFAVAHHYESIDLAIRKLVDLHNDDYDIEDPKIFNDTLERYSLLNDGFCSEAEYIKQEVKKRICGQS